MQNVANLTALSDKTLNGLLIHLSDSRLGIEEYFGEQELLKFEEHVNINFNEFMKTDLSATLAAFVKLGHIPTKVFAQIGDQNELVTFSSSGSFLLLRELISQGLTSHQNLIDKLWDRVYQTHQKLSLNRSFSLMKLAASYQE